MLGLVLFARYISAPMALRYGTQVPKVFSPSSGGLNGSFFISKDQTTIWVLEGYALSILNFSNTFWT
jgi:hypothetical protein